MELVLGQQSSPSSDSTPETPIADPPSGTADPPDLTSHFSTLTSDPPAATLTPDPPAAQPEAPPTETTPTEADAQDEDQVKPGQGSLRRSSQTLSPGLVFESGFLRLTLCLLSVWFRSGTRRRLRLQVAGPLCLT